MNRRPDRLDANERALADLLARDALPGPSPQLDARILAAARSATAMRSSRQRPYRRWATGLGIAASVVFALGIAWRLRPLPPQRPAASEAPAAAARVIEPTAPSPASTPSMAGDTASRMQPRPVAETPKPIPAERESAPEAFVRKPAAPEPAVVSDKPSPIDQGASEAFTAPPPSPPAPAAVAPATAIGTPAPPPVDTLEAVRRDKRAVTLDRIETTGSRIQQADAKEAQPMDAAAAADAAAVDGVPRALLDEEPPATADSPGVQQAWLQRIREMLAAGETEAARNSLVEFQRRYPGYALPRDLRALATP